MNTKLLMGVVTIATLLAVGTGPAWADGEHGYSMRDGGHAAATHQESTGHYLRHLLRHSKEIGLTADQVARLKAIQLELNRTRIKTEAEIQVTELDLAALAEEEKADLSAIEAKVKQSEMLEVDLRMAAVRAKRDAAVLLTPEQREKEKAEHEKMMMQMGRGMAPDMQRGMMHPVPGGMMGGMMGGEEKKDEHRH